MLQIEDIRRLERNDVLPIPISPSAVVKRRVPPKTAREPKLSSAEKPRLIRSPSEWVG
jgi:hypothetical protein